MNPPSPSDTSFRSRIAARKAQIVAATVAAAALAPATAQATIYTVATPATNNLQFDPLDGSTAFGTPPTAENPIFISACLGAVLWTNVSLHGSSDFAVVAAPIESWSKVQTLSAGVTIDASSGYYDPNQFEYSTAPAAYDGTTPYYLGFRYTNQGAGLETYYGWIEFTMSNDTSATVTRFALGGNGQAIVTGQDVSAVPEPAAAAALLGALALGATAARRRRR